MTIPAPEMTELRAMLTKVHDWIANTIFADDERRDEAVNLDSDILATLGAHPIGDTLADGLVADVPMLIADEKGVVLIRSGDGPAIKALFDAMDAPPVGKKAIAFVPAAALTQLRERLVASERERELALSEYARLNCRVWKPAILQRNHTLSTSIVL